MPCLRPSHSARRTGRLRPGLHRARDRPDEAGHLSRNGDVDDICGFDPGPQPVISHAQANLHLGNRGRLASSLGGRLGLPGRSDDLGHQPGVIGASQPTRSVAAILKGSSLSLMVAWVFGTLFHISSVQILRQVWYEYRAEAGGCRCLSRCACFRTSAALPGRFPRRSRNGSYWKL